MSMVLTRIRYICTFLAGGALAVLLVAVTTSVAVAEDTATIYGRVTTDGGEVVGFRVKARLPVAAMTWTVFTRGGQYRIPTLTPGEYDVQVVQRGFASPVRHVELKAGERVEADLHLTVQPGFDVAEQFRQRDSHTSVVQPNAPLASYDEIYPPGPGRDALEWHCAVCHGTWFHNMRKPREGWEWTLANMTDRKSLAVHKRGNLIYTPQHFPEQDRRLILDYLTENFGPEAPYRDVRLDELRPDEAVIGDAVYIEYDVPPAPGMRPRSYHDPYIAPNGEVWFNDRANRSVLHIDPEARDAARMIVEEYQAPWPETSMHGITIDRAGRVYYADIAGGYLGELNRETGTFTRYETTGEVDESLVQIVVDSKDNVWGGLISGNKLMRLDAATRSVKMWDFPTPDTNPYGLIVSRDDRLWAAGISKHKIIRFDPATEQFTEFPTPAQPSSPRRLGEDLHGNIWWAEYTGGHLGVLNPASGEMKQYRYPLALSRGYDAWPVGEFIWSTEATYETLVRFDPATEAFVYYPLPLSQPSGNPGVPKIEVGKDGTIWFAYRGVQGGANPVVAFMPRGNAQP